MIKQERILEQVDWEHLEERTESRAWSLPVLLYIEEHPGLVVSRKQASVPNTLSTRLEVPKERQRGLSGLDRHSECREQVEDRHLELREARIPSGKEEVP